MAVVLIFVEKVAPVFALILVGFLYGKIKKLETTSISELILNLALPCFAFTSVAKIEFQTTDLLAAAVAPIVISLGVGLCVYLYTRFNKGKSSRGLYLPTMFVNAGNIALPVVLLSYGEKGVASALVYTVVIGLLIFSVGILIATREVAIGRMLRQYVLYATGFGLLVNSFQISMPKQLYVPIDMMGAVAIPMLLLTLGYNLNRFHIHSIKFALIGSFFRIGVGFFLSWIIFIKVLGDTSLTAKTIVLLSSMPSAIVVYPIAEQYDANPEMVASVIVASTLISILTIPLVLWVLG
jgi:predicted permease